MGVLLLVRLKRAILSATVIDAGSTSGLANTGSFASGLSREDLSDFTLPERDTRLKLSPVLTRPDRKAGVQPTRQKKNVIKSGHFTQWPLPVRSFATMFFGSPSNFGCATVAVSRIAWFTVNWWFPTREVTRQAYACTLRQTHGQTTCRQTIQRCPGTDQRKSDQLFHDKMPFELPSPSMFTAMLERSNAPELCFAHFRTLFRTNVRANRSHCTDLLQSCTAVEGKRSSQRCLSRPGSGAELAFLTDNSTLTKKSPGLGNSNF